MPPYSRNNPRRAQHTQTGRTALQVAQRWYTVVKLVKANVDMSHSGSKAKVALARPLATYMQLRERERDTVTVWKKTRGRFPKEVKAIKAMAPAKRNK